MTPVFRRAEPADIAAMSRIRLSVTENVLSDPARVTLQMYEDYLDRYGRGWVADIDGAIAAFAYADKRDGSIWALFVDAAYEGRGLAKQLLRLAVDWLFTLGFAQVTLTTTPGTRADRFYGRQGWRRGAPGAREVAYSLPRDDQRQPSTPRLSDFP
ncbi:GNAT family N-acetyltransferase [Massilia sp.]|uniref:GNAT family N-acetyltransferase n=1 Tax=Massilia sp. TaxID=1882437 RepID=UPI00289E0A7E|nr:GNAT family N-acetyltransferase [Massilia sp.]